MSELVLGKYALGRRLASARPGRPWFAVATEVAAPFRRVAVKLATRRDDDPAAERGPFDAPRIRSLRHAAAALARIDHPLATRLIDHGDHDGRPALVMSMVPGHPLELGLLQAMAPPDRARIALQLASVVAHLQARGVLHRDLKPGNLLVTTPAGAPRIGLVDFDLARPACGHRGETSGSAGYAAPEQATLDAAWLDLRADLFGLGASLYTILFAEPPFPDRAEAVRVAALRGPPRPSPRICSRELWEVLATLMAPRREDRTISAAATLAAIGRAVGVDPREAVEPVETAPGRPAADADAAVRALGVEPTPRIRAELASGLDGALIAGRPSPAAWTERLRDEAALAAAHGIAAARLALRLGRPVEALEHATPVVEDAPHGDAFAVVSEAFLALRAPGDAERHAIRAVELAPDRATCWLALARAQLALGTRADAALDAADRNLDRARVVTAIAVEAQAGRIGRVIALCDRFAEPAVWREAMTALCARLRDVRAHAELTRVEADEAGTLIGILTIAAVVRDHVEGDERDGVERWRRRGLDDLLALGRARPTARLLAALDQDDALAAAIGAAGEELILEDATGPGLRAIALHLLGLRAIALARAASPLDRARLHHLRGEPALALAALGAAPASPAHDRLAAIARADQAMRDGQAPDLGAVTGPAASRLQIEAAIAAGRIAEARAQFRDAPCADAVLHRALRTRLAACRTPEELGPVVVWMVERGDGAAAQVAAEICYRAAPSDAGLECVAQALVSAGQADRARAICEAAVATRPTPRRLTLLAELELATGRSIDAIATGLRALAGGPSPVAELVVMRAALITERFELAAAALASDDDGTAIAVTRVHAQLARGEIDPALDTARALVGRVTDPDELVLLVRAFRFAPVAERLARATEAARRHDQDPRLIRELGVAALEAGDLDAAWSSAQRLLGLSPLDDDWELALRVLDRIGRAPELLALARMATHLGGPPAITLEAQLHAHAAQGEWADGLRAGLAGLRHRAPGPRAWEDLAVCWAATGDLGSGEHASQMRARTLGVDGVLADDGPGLALALLLAALRREPRARLEQLVAAAVSARPDDAELAAAVDVLAGRAATEASSPRGELLLRALTGASA